MALTDQQIRDEGFKYVPLQQYLLNPFELPQGADNEGIGSGDSGGIPFTNVGQAGGGGGANPFGALNPTFTRENPLSIPAISDMSSKNLSTYLSNPALQAKYENFAEYDEFMQDQLPSPNLINQGITSIKDTFGRFFKPKIKGTLGDRLVAQATGPLSGIPTISNILSKLRSPFNPNSPTYNAALPSQLNFLEGATGIRITGTSDNLKVTDGLAMIGRDPNTGGLKYGPGSVLFGKNVISGFGTNDYEQALNDYISKMTARGKLSEFQKAKLRQANTELANLQAKQEEEYRTGGTRDEVIDLQERIDKGDFDSTSDKPDRDRGSVTTESAAKSKGVGGGGYTARDSVRDSFRGQYKTGGLAGILGY
jgi:hypothetical protein